MRIYLEPQVLKMKNEKMFLVLHFTGFCLTLLTSLVSLSLVMCKLHLPSCVFIIVLIIIIIIIYEFVKTMNGILLSVYCCSTTVCSICVTFFFYLSRFEIQPQKNTQI